MALGEALRRDLKTSLRMLTRRLEILEGIMASPEFKGKSLRNIGTGSDERRSLRYDESNAIGGIEILVNCTAAESVSDAVYIYGSEQARRASATDISTAKVIGFVTSKPTNTTCYVLLFGVYAGFGGLTPGAGYFLSESAGQIVTWPPTAPATVVNHVGIALTTTKLFVNLSDNYMIRS